MVIDSMCIITERDFKLGTPLHIIILIIIQHTYTHYKLYGGTVVVVIISARLVHVPLSQLVAINTDYNFVGVCQ